MLLLGDYIFTHSPRDKIAYVPPEPISDYVNIADLSNKPRFGWRLLPYLNFKLKFQT